MTVISSSKAPRRWRKRILWAVAALLALLLLLLLAAPTLVGAMGRDSLLAVVNGKISGRVKAKSISLSWFGGQSIRGFELDDPEGRTVVSFDSLDTEASLLGLVRQNLNIGKTGLASLKISLKQDEGGKTGLDRALEPREAAKESGGKEKKPAAKKDKSDDKSKPATAGSVPASLAVDFSLTDAHVLMQSALGEKVEIDVPKGSIAMPSISKPIAVDLAGTAKQEDLTGEFNMKGKIEGLFDSSGRITPDKARGNADFSGTNLPAEALDRLAQSDGALAAALGGPLSFALKGDGSQDQAKFQLNAKAKFLDVNIVGERAQGRARLTQPGKASFLLTPALVAKLSGRGKREPLRLKADSAIELSIPRLEAPQGPGAVTGAVAQATLKAGEIRLTGDPELGEVALRGFEAALDMESLDKGLNLNVKGGIEQGGQVNPISIDATVTNLVDAKGQIQPGAATVNATASLPDLPVATLDRLGKQDGVLLAALGPRLNIQMAAQTGADRRMEGRITAKAERLQAEIPFAGTEKHLVFSAPATAKFTVTPALMKKLSSKDQQATLEKPAVITASVDRFAMPMAKDNGEAVGPADIRIEGSVQSEQITILGPPNIGKIIVSDLSAKLSGESLAAMDLSFALSASQAGADGLLTQATGPEVKIRGSAKGSAPMGGAAKPLDLLASLASERLNLGLEGKVSPDGFAMSKPIEVDYTLTPATVARLSPPKEGQPALSEPAKIHLSVTKLELPSKGGELQARANGTIDKIVLSGAPSVGRTSLTGATMTMEADSARDEAKLHLEGKTNVEGQNAPGSLALDALATGILGPKGMENANAALKADAKLTGFPSVFLDAFSGEGAKFSELAGGTVDLESTANFYGPGLKKGGVTMKTRSERLTADAGLEMGDKLTLSKPATAKLTLTPQAFAALVPAKEITEEDKKKGGVKNLRLQETAVFDAKFDQLEIPLAAQPKGKSDPMGQIKLAGLIASKRVVFLDSVSRQSAVFDTVNARFGSGGGKGALSMALQSGLTMSGAGAAGQPAAVAQKGKIDIRYDTPLAPGPDGKIEWLGDATNVVADVSGLPVGWLDSLLGMEGQLVAILGDVLGLGVGLGSDIGPGSLKADVQSAVSKAVIQAQIRGGSLQLREPLQAQFTVTPQLGQSLLKRINPLLMTAVGAQQPIQFMIAKEGFDIPIKPFVLEKASIDRAELRLGTIFVENGGALEGLFKLLKKDVGKQTTAQFTPFVAHLKNGIATYDRTDMVLADEYKMSTWGQVDLVKDYVDMQLGISADTVEKIAGVKGLDPDSTVTVPMRGPTAKVKPDWSGATKQIAQLAIQGQLAGKLGGEKGALLNQLLGGGQPAPAPQAATAPAAPGEQSPQATPTPERQQDALGGLLGQYLEKKQKKEEEKKKKKKAD